MATLNGNITATQRNIRVTDGAAVLPSQRLRLDDELIDFIRFEPYPYINGVRRHGLDPTRWVVSRGVGDSVNASHLSGATLTAAVQASVSSDTLTPPDPFADGTGGSGVTVDNQSDPPVEVTTLVVPGATIAGNEADLSGVLRMRLLGPFPITYQTADLETGATVATVAAGSLVIKAFLITSAFFEESLGANPGGILIRLDNGADSVELTNYDPENQRIGNASARGEGGVLDFSAGGIQTSVQVIAQCELVVQIFPNTALVAGAGSVYALIAEPVA